MRIKKIFFRTSAFSLILFAIVFFGQRFVNLKSHEQKIKQAIEENFSTPSISMGKITINFLPSYAHINKISIQYSTTGYENISLAISTVKIKFSLLSLFLGKLKIKTIHLENPSITGNQDNLRSILFSLLKNTNINKKPINIQNISFNEGSANFSEFASADKIKGEIKIKENSFVIDVKSRHKSGQILALSATNKSYAKGGGIDYNLKLGNYAFFFKTKSDENSEGFIGEISGSYIGENNNKESTEIIKNKTKLQKPGMLEAKYVDQEKTIRKDNNFIKGKIKGTISNDKANDYYIEGMLKAKKTIDGTFLITLKDNNLEANLDFDFVDIDKIINNILYEFKGQKLKSSIFNTLTENKLVTTISATMDTQHELGIDGSIKLKIKNLLYNRQQIKNTSISAEIKKGSIKKYIFESNLPHDTKINNFCSKRADSKNLICELNLKSNNAKEFILWSSSVYPEGLDNPDNKITIIAKIEFAKNILIIKSLDLKANDTSINIEAMIKKLKKGASAFGSVQVSTNSLPSFITTILNKIDLYQKSLDRRSATIALHSWPISYDFSFNLSEKITNKNTKPNSVYFNAKYRNQTFRLDKININYDNIFKANGDIGAGIDRLDAVMNADIAIHELNLDKIKDISMLEFKDKKQPKVLSFIKKISEILNKPLSIFKDGSMKVKISGLKASSLDIGNIDAKISISDRSIEINYIKGKVFDGDINYRSKTTMSNDRTTTIGNFIINNANCSNIYKALTGKEDLESYCSIGGIFNSNATKKSNWLENLAGKIQWTSVGTKTPIIDLDLISDKILKVKSTSELISLLDAASLRQAMHSMGSVSGASEISKGLLISKFKFEDEGISGSGISQIMLNNMITNNKLKFSIIPYDSVSTITFDLDLKGSFIDRVESSFDYNQISRELKID